MQAKKYRKEDQGLPCRVAEDYSFHGFQVYKIKSKLRTKQTKSMYGRMSMNRLLKHKRQTDGNSYQVNLTKDGLSVTCT